jgi:hypothetical protein
MTQEDSNAIPFGHLAEHAPKPHAVPWQWRWNVIEYIASHTNADYYGVKGFYLIGSTKNATAGPASDIDLIVHVHGSEAQQRALEAWLDTWSRHLDELNYQHTGHRTGGLLDVHFVTDEDIRKQTSFACKIGAINDGARKLPMM